MRTFTCPSCHATFAWKDSYLNRRVSCRCGCVFDAFEDPPEEPDPIDPYDVADDATGVAIPPGPTVAQPAAGHQPGLTPYPERRAKPQMVTSESDRPSMLRDVMLPAVFLIAGVVIMIAQGVWTGPAGESVVRPIALNAVFLALMVLTMLGGGAIAGSVLGIEFGPIGRVAFKLAGTGALAGAVALVVAGLDKSDSLTGPIVAWNLVFIIYWICFHLLFELDLQENLLSVAIIAFLQAVVGCILWTI